LALAMSSGWLWAWFAQLQKHHLMMGGLQKTPKK
jgi:hypothetical protein